MENAKKAREHTKRTFARACNQLKRVIGNKRTLTKTGKEILRLKKRKEENYEFNTFSANRIGEIQEAIQTFE